MDELESPIEVRVNTSRLLMDRIHGLLEFECRNRSSDESFEVEVRVRLRGRQLGGVDAAPRQRLLAGERRPCHLQISLDAGAEGGSAAGDAVFGLEIDVSSGGESHRFCGQFVMTVLAYAESMRQVTVNIGKVIEQHDKAGMGSVNEIELSNLVNLPESMDVNTLLDKAREPRWVTVPLHHAGAVAVSTRPAFTLRRGGHTGHRRLSVARRGEDLRLLVISELLVRIGREGSWADIAARSLPASPHPLHAVDEEIAASVHAGTIDGDHARRRGWLERVRESDPTADERMIERRINHWKGRTVSREHLELRCDPSEHGLSVAPRATRNRTLLDGRLVRGRVAIPIDRPSCRLHVGDHFQLVVRPLAAPHHEAEVWESWIDLSENRRSDLWRWSQRAGVGGLLLERTDGWRHRERYLWLFSAVTLADLGLARGPHRTRIVIAAMPHLVAVHLGDAGPIKILDHHVRPFQASVLAEGDLVEVGDDHLEIADFRQMFED